MLKKYFLFILVFVVIGGQSIPAFSQNGGEDPVPIPKEEYDALVKLFNTTAGLGWKTYWDVSKNNVHEGGWYGVTVQDGHVTKLNLSGNYLRGEIPRELANLTMLTDLNLSGNTLSGSIPQEIGKLTSLKTLYLNNNKLSGSVPATFMTTESLTTLQLQYNSFSDIAEGIKPKISVNFNYQTVEYDVFQYKGDTVDVTVPRISTYNYSLNNFTAKNQFYFRINGANAVTVYADDEGKLRIPKSVLSALKKSDKMSIYQYNGTAAYSIINFRTTSITLPKVPDSEYEALVAIYKSLNGANWQANLRWNISENNLHEGTWPGVTLENGHIVSLNLYANGYYTQGTIPKEIGNLTHLRTLNLQSYHGYYITGEVPAEIGNLKELTFLNLHDQRVTTIPESIKNCTQLKTVYLGRNFLTAISEGFKNLNELTTLHLYNNQITGSLPAWLATMPALKDLQLHSNKLSGAIPKEFNTKGSITTLYLNSNLLEDIETGIASGISLNLNSQTTYQRVFEFKGDTVDITVPRISTYNYSLNNFTAKNQFYFRINGGNITTLSANDEGKLRVPKNLLLALKKNDKVSFYQTSGTTAGTTINFDSTAISLSKVPDSEYEALVAIYKSLNGANWQAAVRWNISENNLHEGAWPGVTLEDGHIISLNLYANGYYTQGTIPKEIGNLTHLRTLNLQRYHSYYITGEVPAEIGNLKELTFLNLHDQRISTIPENIKNCTQLKTVYLGQNFLTAISEGFKNLNELTTLHLYNNQITGSLPAWLVMMPALKDLQIQGNKLLGAIPKEFNTKGSITTLYLNSNLLEDIETGIASGISLNLNYQTTYQRVFEFKGDTVDITVPRISTYNYSTNTFTAKNQFYFRINGGNITTLSANDEGKLRVPKNLLLALKKNDKVSFYQTSGTTTGTTINFDSTAISLPKVPDSEYEALVAIYKSLNGANWQANLRWNISENNLHEGTWPGVTLENGHIVSLNLYGSGYYTQGTIPKEIGNLTHLRTLNLQRYHGYYITGEVPAEIGNLKELTYLNLHDQRISTIPENIKNCTQLKTVYLGQNFLTAISEGFKNLNELTTLHLYNNQITGSLPAWLATMPALKDLQLQSNKLSGAIPKEFNTKGSITTLYLNNNMLEDVEEGIASGISLNLNSQTTYQRVFEFKGDTVDITVPRISTYNYSTNTFTAKNQFYFRINGANITTLSANDEGKLQIPKNVLTPLKKNDKVTLYQINGTSAYTTIGFDSMAISLPKIPNSEYEALVAIYKSLNGASWSSNVRWNVSENNLHEGAWPGVALEDGHIVGLNLYENGFWLVGSIPPEIGNLTYLRTLNFSNYNGGYSYYYITGEIPTEMGKLVHLENLSIQQHKITGTLLSWLDKLVNLKTLDLYNNQLTGNIPASIEKLTNLTSINLSNNQLSGILPDYVGNLQYLSALNLANNKLTGSIPASLNDLPSIRSLILNNNQFEALEKPLPYQPHITVNVANQTINKDKIMVGGDYVYFDLPLVCRYDHARGSFHSIANFALYINNVKKVTVESDLEGKVRFSSVYFSDLKEGDKISIRQETGSATGTAINFDEFYVGQKVDDQEYAALVDLYNSTDGENWLYKWDVTSNDLHQRMWYGVVVEDGHVIKLELQNNLLNGTLPASLSKLTKLRHLSVYNNNLTGAIPASLGSLPELKTIVMFKNKLTGNIPSELGNAGTLLEIQLQNNQLSGTIPTSLINLSSLSNLNISNNKFSGTIPDVLLSLPHIKSLDLSYNQYNRLNAAFAYDDSVSVTLHAQTISIDDYMYREGSVVRAEIAQLNRYNFDNRSFDAQNMYEFYIDGIYKGQSDVIEDNMIVFNDVLNDYTDGQNITITQRNGTLFGSTLLYKGLQDLVQLPVETSEYKALVAFYQAMGGAEWTNKWDTAVNDIHQAKWHGVTYRNGHIIGLNLENNNLTGEIPDLFDALPYLGSVNFAQNKLSGTVPASLTTSESINRLILADNNISRIASVISPDVIFNIDRQIVDMGNTPLARTFYPENFNLNIYDHAGSSFLTSRNYKLVMGAYSRNITIKEGTPYVLADLMREWTIPNNQLLTLTQLDGFTEGMRINYNLTFKNGDANMDNSVNVLDMQHLVNYTFNSYSGSFNKTAADLNKDAKINVLDIVAVAAIIQGTSIETQDETRSALRAASNAPVQLSIENGILYINSNVAVAAFDIRLDNAGKFEIQPLLLSDQHPLSVTYNENQTGLLMFSTDPHSLLRGKTAIAKIGSATIKEALISDAHAQKLDWELSDTDSEVGIGESSENSNVVLTNYPNPFTDRTVIECSLPNNTQSVKLQIMDLNGKLIFQKQTIINQNILYKETFERQDLPSGLYIYSLDIITSSDLLKYKNKMIIK